MSTPARLAAPAEYTPRLLHTMLRVRELSKSLDFYTNKLGMALFRYETYPSGQFTLAFVGYGTAENSHSIELTYNWDGRLYDPGSAFGHIAIAVCDLERTCRELAAEGVEIARQPGPISKISPERTRPEKIAFILDPDGYLIELIEDDRP